MGPGGCHLSSGLDLIFADETLLHTRGAEGTGSDVSAGPEQRVSLHVGAHHALLQRLDVAVQRRAAGAHLPTGPFRGKQQRVCESRTDCKRETGRKQVRQPRRDQRGKHASLHPS